MSAMNIRKVVAAYATMAAKATKPPGSGWEKILGGKDEHGGMRRKKSGGGYEYWYPSEKHAWKAQQHHRGEADGAADAAASATTSERKKQFRSAARSHLKHWRGAMNFIKRH